jgi:anaerobic magnesium-protoporphyrin IX monomethyl ester cyclase
MDILFINPPWHKKSGNVWKNISACLPPFNLALLAAIAKEKGFSASILDCNALRLDFDKIQKILPEKPPKFIGITATTVLIDSARKIAGLAREKYPKTKIIIGGAHPTVRPKETLNFKEIDFIAMGEGENSLLGLLSGKNPTKIKGIGFKKNGELIINSLEETIPDINIFPILAYDLLPMNKYYPASGSYKRKPSFGMVTSRGCPGNCTFCKGDILGKKTRFRSAQKIVEEIEFLQKNYNIKDITFYDDTFTSNKQRINDFCDVLIKKKIDLTWCCFSRVDTIDFEILKKMKMAGCYQVMYGVESADPQILANIKKRITLEQVEKAVNATKKTGIETRLAFMIGNPGETEKTIKKTIKYAVYLDPDLVSFNIATPYPGTEMFEWAEKNNYLIHKNWPEYDLSQPVMKIPSISKNKILKYYKKSHIQFYFRPSYFLKRLLKIKNFNDFKASLNPFIGLLKFISNR